MFSSAMPDPGNELPGYFHKSLRDNARPRQ